MKTKLYTIIAAIILLLSSCTDQERAKGFGGTAEVELPAKQKLINVTWKETNLWYLTRPMREGEKAETFTLQESSSFGVMEGKVIFKETE